MLEANIGLERVKTPVKLLTLVAGTDEFYDHPAVANGGSCLLVLSKQLEFTAHNAGTLLHS